MLSSSSKMMETFASLRSISLDLLSHENSSSVTVLTDAHTNYIWAMVCKHTHYSPIKAHREKKNKKNHMEIFGERRTLVKELKSIIQGLKADVFQTAVENNPKRM